MTGSLVPDASVAVKWVVREPGSDTAVALLRDGRKLCAPGLLRVEVRAALVRAFRKGALSEADARDRLADCGRLISERRVRYVDDTKLLAEAAEIALRIKHSLQDCLYIACAARVGGELVTADATLHSRASGEFPFVRLL